MAVTSKGARRVNGHFCDSPDMGTHTTQNNCVGLFHSAEEANEAQARVQKAKDHYRKKAKPFENETQRLYALQIAEMERAATDKDWEPVE